MISFVRVYVMDSFGTGPAGGNAAELRQSVGKA